MGRVSATASPEQLVHPGSGHAHVLGPDLGHVRAGASRACADLQVCDELVANLRTNRGAILLIKADHR